MTLKGLSRNTLGRNFIFPKGECQMFGQPVFFKVLMKRKGHLKRFRGFKVEKVWL